MKCEICHKKDAAAAIVVKESGGEQELYVCHDCEKAERARRQKRSQRTRKASGAAASVEVNGAEMAPGEEPPPIVAAIMNAVTGFVSSLEQATHEARRQEQEADKIEISCAKVKAVCRIGSRLHLEGLNMLGEIEPVKRALRALGMELASVDMDGLHDVGHVYLLRTPPALKEAARRVLEDLVREECNARIRLFEEVPLVFGDALCRALAILKNCRLLGPAELFDLLSPLRLAAIEDMLEGIDLATIEHMLEEIDLSTGEDRLAQDVRDEIDANRADEINKRFENVLLNERAEGKFL